MKPTGWYIMIVSIVQNNNIPADPGDIVVRVFPSGPGGHGFNPGGVSAVTLKNPCQSSCYSH